MDYLERAMERYPVGEGYRRYTRRLHGPTNDADDWICLSLSLTCAEDGELMDRSRVVTL